MTREEKLDWLYRLRSEIWVYMPKEWLIPMNEALDYAIKALEQEPCEDCISRQAVIDAIEDDNRNGNYSCFASNNDAECFKDVIRSLSSVTPKPKTDVLDKIKADVINIADGKQSIKVRSVLRIINKHKAESENKE